MPMDLNDYNDERMAQTTKAAFALRRFGPDRAARPRRDRDTAGSVRHQNDRAGDHARGPAVRFPIGWRRPIVDRPTHYRRKHPMGPKLVDYLLYEPEPSGILWIKFNLPERMNALVGPAEENSTVAKVGEYMRAGDDDPSVRVIILTGVGRGFCSGANLGNRTQPGENFPGNRSPNEGLEGTRQHFIHGFTDLHRDISLIRKPTIAMINGPAVGSGRDVAPTCDIR